MGWSMLGQGLAQSLRFVIQMVAFGHAHRICTHDLFGFSFRVTIVSKLTSQPKSGVIPTVKSAAGLRLLEQRISGWGRVIFAQVNRKIFLWSISLRC